MSTLRPFHALRPTPERASEVAAVPYDVVDRQEAYALAHTKPLSFLHISRAEIDLPLDTDPYDPKVYAQASANLAKLTEQGVLISDSEPAVYVYQLQMGSHVQTGIAATFSVDEYDNGQIKKHEKTRKAKEDDRTRHIIATQAQTGPVFLAYRAVPEIDAIVEKVTKTEPLYNFTAEDGIRHTVWKVSDCDALVKAFAEKVPVQYIADGHHRAASASRTRAKLRSEAAEWTGKEAANYFLAVTFPDNQLRILAYNRVVADLNGKTPAELLDALKKVVPVQDNATAEPSQDGHVSMYLDHNWYDLDLNALKAKAAGPAERLDAAVLQENVLAPLLGIGDPRTDERIDFVGGIRGTDELVKRVDSGKMAVAFSMRPVSLHELMDIADAGQIMPPKSTWFEPKLRDSIVNHDLR
ncbi:DUF1015 domain-containing protein [bacterium]|nr:DUF1015 domain-containing protein [bacterium]